MDYDTFSMDHEVLCVTRSCPRERITPMTSIDNWDVAHVGVARVTWQAFDEQERRIQALGGREAVLKRGSYPYTPAPGEPPRYS